MTGDGAHLVGHSYGGLGVLFAAARRPAATLSLTLLEPATFALGQADSAARSLVADQFAGPLLNDALLALWRNASRTADAIT